MSPDTTANHLTVVLILTGVQ